MTAGVANAILSPLSPITKPIGQGIDYIANKISDNPNIQNFANTKAGEVATRVAGDVNNLATIFGVVGGGEELPSVKGAISTGGEKLVNTTTNIAKPLLNTTGRVLKNVAEKTYGVTVTPEEATTQAVRKYNAKQPTLFSRIKNVVTGNQPEGKPITEANTAARLGLAGTEKELGVQATRASNQLWDNVIKPKLSAVNGKLNMKTFLGEIEKDISSGTKGIRKTQLLESLNTIKDEFKRVNKISLEKLQSYKEDWAKFIPEASYKGKPISSAIKDVQNMMAEKARKVLYKYIGEEGKQAYIDYGNLKSLEKAADKSVKDPAKQSLTKDVWQFIMDKAVTPIATISGKYLYKTGEGLEFMGNKGAKTVNDIIQGTTDIPQKLKVKELPSDYKPPVQTKLPVNHLPSDYINGSPKKLPTIEMGNKPKPSKGNLPVIDMGKDSPTIGKIASNDSQSLLQEAKKYKSADEFVKAVNSKTLLHGGVKELKGGKLTTGMGVNGDAGGIFFSPNTPTGEMYARSYTLKGSIKNGEGAIHKVMLKPDAKIFDASNPKDIAQLSKFAQPEIINDITSTSRNGQMDWATGAQYFDNIKEAGFSGAKLSERPAGFKLFDKSGKMVDAPADATSVVVFDNKHFNHLPSDLTKSQLTDIWKKANKK